MVGVEQGFPFAGYELVLDRIVERTPARTGTRVLDLGSGTAALTTRLAGTGCELVSVGAARLTGGFVELGPRFDGVVSAYAFHALRPTERRRLVTHVFERYLVRDGTLVIGDISFATAADRDRVRRDLGRRWDDRDLYLVADEEAAAFAELGLKMTYEPVSFCAGVFTVHASHLR
jgi:putative AdoMet-dependent methyltransferase